MQNAVLARSRKKAEGVKSGSSYAHSAYEHTDARPAAKEPEEKEPEAREKKESGSRDKKKKLVRDGDQRELAKQVANQVRLLLLVI
jgi:hypothetical protein